MIRAKWTARLLAAGAAILTGAQAQAGLLPNSVTVTPEAGNFRWTYAVVLPTDSQLQAGNYFTIFNFAGYVPGAESTPTGWSFMASKNGPAPGQLNPNRDPSLYDLTWTYNGPTVPSGQLGLGNFMADSTMNQQLQKMDNFAASSNRTSDRLPDYNLTSTITPGPDTTGTGGGTTGGTTTPPPGVPEPTTLLLTAVGLPLAGLLRRRLK